MRAGARDYIMKGNLARLGPPSPASCTRRRRGASGRRLEEQLRQAQKMEAIGRLAGGVAHDFNNLLTVIRGCTEFLLDQLPADDPGRREAGHDPRGRASARPRSPGSCWPSAAARSSRPRVLDLNVVVARDGAMLRRLIGERHRRCGLVLDPTLGPVKADPGQLEQVIMNLVVNARDAMPDGGQLTIETANVELDEAYCRARVGSRPGPHVMLAVSDTGVGHGCRDAGASLRALLHHQGRRQGHGARAGHRLRHRQAERRPISSLQRPGQGTSVKIYLPRAAAPMEAYGHTSRSSRDRSTGTETILLVEDEETVRPWRARSCAATATRCWRRHDGDSAPTLGRARGHPPGRDRCGHAAHGRARDIRRMAPRRPASRCCSSPATRTTRSRLRRLGAVPGEAVHGPGPSARCARC